MYKPLAICLFTLFALVTHAQIPSGYYTAAALAGSGNPLKNALRIIITNGHAEVTYANVWNAFYTTDVKPNGKVWDMYSYKFTGAQPYEFTLGTSQCGTYSAEGDCYNREHTWPQSFFASDEPMKSDLHQVFATDGFVNGIHADLPYGDVITADKTTANGSKKGSSSSYTGYSGDVFEPIDSFKGDIARAYFYMTTRYGTVGGGWSNWPMANGANLTIDAISLLMTWHNLDPVSQKEINRNNEIYKLQGNRNPFVDVPAFADCIWGTSTCNWVSINAVNWQNAFTYINTAAISINTTALPSNAQFTLYNLQGNIIQQYTTLPSVIDVSGLPKQVYYLRMATGTQAKIIKLYN
jgi:endonuclease I